MTTLGMDEKGRWGFAAIGGVVFATLLVLLFRAPLVVQVPPVAVLPKATLALIKPDHTTAALNEQTLMHDTTPLFLPILHADTYKEEPRRGLGKTFLDNDRPKLGFGETGLDLGKDLPPVATLNGKPPATAAGADALSPAAPGEMTLGFGRDNLPILPIVRRGGFLEVIAMASGQRVLTERLPIAAKAPTEKAWQPMEFFATVDAAGLVGPLVVTESSRAEEVDDYFRKFLVQTFRIGERLRPGFYRIIVGP